MAEGRLQEVEEDAMYITQKRFDEAELERSRNAEKQARAEEKANKSEQSEKKGK